MFQALYSQIWGENVVIGQFLPRKCNVDTYDELFQPKDT